MPGKTKGRGTGLHIGFSHHYPKLCGQTSAELLAAEDALRKLQERLVASVYNGTIDPHEALKIAEDAIAAISEEGGAK